ncbi:MAG: hypothetical protein ACOYMV_08090 [Verrucomicrobiia bacterium]
MSGPVTVAVGARCVACGAWVAWAELANETLCSECRVEDRNSGMDTIEIGNSGGVSACVIDRVGGGWYAIDEDGYILPRARWRDGAEHQAEMERRALAKKREEESEERRRIRAEEEQRWRKAEYERGFREMAREEALFPSMAGGALRSLDKELNLSEIEMYPERWPETFLRLQWVREYCGADTLSLAKLIERLRELVQ